MIKRRYLTADEAERCRTMTDQGFRDLIDAFPAEEIPSSLDRHDDTDEFLRIMRGWPVGNYTSEELEQGKRAA